MCKACGDDSVGRNVTWPNTKSQTKSGDLLCGVSLRDCKRWHMCSSSVVAPTTRTHTGLREANVGMYSKCTGLLPQVDIASTGLLRLLGTSGRVCDHIQVQQGGC